MKTLLASISDFSQWSYETLESFVNKTTCGPKVCHLTKTTPPRFSALSFCFANRFTLYKSHPLLLFLLFMKSIYEENSDHQIVETFMI